MILKKKIGMPIADATYKSTTFNRDLIDDYHFKSSKAPCYRQKIADNVSAVIT